LVMRRKMSKSLWRTHSCVPRSHSCERWASRLAQHAACAIEHMFFKMFAHMKLSGIGTLVRTPLVRLRHHVQNGGRRGRRPRARAPAPHNESVSDKKQKCGCECYGRRHRLRQTSPCPFRRPHRSLYYLKVVIRFRQQILARGTNEQVFFQRLAVFFRLHPHGIFFPNRFGKVMVKASVHNKNLSWGDETDPQPCDPEILATLLYP
jgi:hypothetical protein